jgi:hypothetical protein
MAFPSDQTVEKNNQNYSSFSNASSVGDDVELVYIQDNEMVLVPDDKRPKGSFYVLPMRTMSDKMYYGTGVAYLTGISWITKVWPMVAFMVQLEDFKKLQLIN